MNVIIKQVMTKKQKKQFLHFPWKIYKNNPNWVAPLISERKERFNKDKFPFFEHSEAEFFLAEKNGEIAGRIVAIKNNMHLKVYNDYTGFFGFFESINDREVANALFDVAVKWVSDKGLKKIRGPENYSQNEGAGLLINAFDKPPVIEMSYNPAYYVDLIENYGFSKKKDLYAYNIENAQEIPKRLQKYAKVLTKRYNFTVRTVDMKNIDREVENIKKIYNAAWNENWGAVPFTDAEIDHVKKQLLPIINPDLVFLAEVDGETVGVSLTIPDFNEVFIKLNGRLFPFGIFKLLWYQRKIQSARVYIMGVLKEHRYRGIDTVFYYETFKNGFKHGYHSGEMSWILEDNYPMRNALEKIYGAKIYKTYRLYEKEVAK